MAEHEDDTINEFSTSLERMATQTAQLEDVLVRTQRALNKQGVQLSVDLPDMAHDVQRALTAVQRRSHRVTERVDQLTGLLRTIALITSSLELDQVLAEVMDTVIHMTGAERAYLMLTHKQSEQLVVRAARNWDRETVPDDEISFSRSVIDTALAGLESIVTTNAQVDARFQAMKSVVQHGLRSIICIPLAMHGEVVGVLYADNRIDKGVFDQEDVPLLTAFGIQAAIAIQNARRFEKVQDDLREARRELEHLQIQIDRQQVAQQVSEITESDYFERLSEAAQRLKASRGQRDQSE